MPSAETFSIPPIRDLLSRNLNGTKIIVDPFARDSKIGTLTNDLDPQTSATKHMEAAVFCRELLANGVQADAVLFDPPYSRRQIEELYRGIGMAEWKATTTKGSRPFSEVRDALHDLLRVGGIAVSFGFDSTGFGKGRGYEHLEVLLVCHGGAHSDTIVTVERKVQTRLP